MTDPLDDLVAAQLHALAKDHPHLVFPWDGQDIITIGRAIRAAVLKDRELRADTERGLRTALTEAVEALALMRAADIARWLPSVGPAGLLFPGFPLSQPDAARVVAAFTAARAALADAADPAPTEEN